MGCRAAPFSSSNPEACLELYVPCVMSEPKTQTFPLLSPHVGEMVCRQNFVGTGHNIDVSTTSKVIISAKNKRTLTGVHSFVMWTASLLFPLDAPVKVCTTRFWGSGGSAHTQSCSCCPVTLPPHMRNVSLRRCENPLRFLVFYTRACFTREKSLSIAKQTPLLKKKYLLNKGQSRQSAGELHSILWPRPFRSVYYMQVGTNCATFLKTFMTRIHGYLG